MERIYRRRPVPSVHPLVALAQRPARRNIGMKLRALTRAAATALAAVLAGPVAAQDARPNIVMIFADDMGWGDLSANNPNAWVKTPNIDAIGAAGIRFTNGYSVAPLCGPSRTGLLTGAYPARFGNWDNPDTGRMRLPATQALLPDVIRRAGYVSGVVGKWNLPVDVRRYADSVYHPMIWGGAYWPSPDGRYVGVGSGYGGGSEPSGVWGPAQPGERYLTDLLTDDAVDFLKVNARRRFFLYLAYNAPHSPLQAAERFRARVKHLPTEPQRLYAAMLLAMDDGVGRVRAELRRLGLERNTMVVFVSDNGPAHGGFAGWKPEWPKNLQLGLTGPLSGSKDSFREGGIREPFLISWPARIVAGQVRHDPVSTIDLYRTFAALSGAALPKESVADGLDLSGFLVRPGTKLADRNIYWAGRKCVAGRCVDSGAMRRGAWKLLIERGSAPRLFNLVTDPGEQRDLAAGEAQRVAGMGREYLLWKRDMPISASIANPPRPAAGGGGH